MMPMVRSLNALLSFVLEMAMLAAFSWAGFELGRSPMNWFALVGAPLLAILVWGFFAAPRSRRRLPQPARTVLELGFMLLAAAGLWLIGRTVLALPMAALAIVNQLTLLFAGEFDMNADASPS